MRIRTLAALPALAFLVACGGGDIGEPPPPECPGAPGCPRVVGPTALQTGLPQPFRSTQIAAHNEARLASYDERSDTLRIFSQQSRNPPQNTVLVRNLNPALPAPANFRAYWIGNTSAEALAGASPSGAVVYVSRWEDNGFQRGYARFGEATIPASGTAEFAGIYYGLLGEGLVEKQEYAGLIAGVVEMTADFSAMQINGEIAGRVNDSGRNFDKLILNTASISASNGSFEGQTSRGILLDRPGPPYTSVQGSWNGILAGTDGAEVVGTVSVVHGGAGRLPLWETGAFTATRAP